MDLANRTVIFLGGLYCLGTSTTTTRNVDPKTYTWKSLMGTVC